MTHFGDLVRELEVIIPERRSCRLVMLMPFTSTRHSYLLVLIPVFHSLFITVCLRALSLAPCSCHGGGHSHHGECEIGTAGMADGRRRGACSLRL